jgi:hypothetical protein
VSNQQGFTPPPPTPDAADLLDDVCDALERFIVWPADEQVDFVALWVLHTYVFHLFDITPYLDISSASKRSGKSRLLEMLAMMCARPWKVVSPSESVLFRKIHNTHPTLLVDEVDATFGKDPQSTEGLRAILNAGYEMGGSVPRCVGGNFTPFDFDVYCPKAFAGIGGLPDTVKDRSGHIELRRRAPHESKPERLLRRQVYPQLLPLASRLDQWGQWVEASGVFSNAKPTLPNVLDDRAYDGCEVLGAIAELAGGEWPERGRAAFMAIMGAKEDADHGVLLLGHVAEAFQSRDSKDLRGHVTEAERLTSAELLRILVDRGDDSPWSGWWGDDLDSSRTRRPAMALARMLRPYDIKPKTIRLPGVGGKEVIAKGYYRADFTDAWKRYVSP